MTVEVVKAALGAARQALDELLANEATLARIDAGAQLLATALRAKGRVFSCGNGGSMCDAMHFAEEMTGRSGHATTRSILPSPSISNATGCAHSPTASLPRTPAVPYVTLSPEPIIAGSCGFAVRLPNATR